MNSEIQLRLKAFREERDAIRKHLASVFRYGGAVRVDYPRFRGNGVFIALWHEDPTMALVRIPNGNEWTYPVEHVQPMDPRTLMPGDRLDYLRFRRVPCSGVTYRRTLNGRLP